MIGVRTRMWGLGAMALLMTAGALACQPQLPFGGQEERAAAAAETAATEQPASPAPATGAVAEAGIDLEALARRPTGRETVCRTFARKIAEAALRHDGDVDAFLAELQDEFVGGTDDPFELKAGLRESSWNQRYFYAGHGGFRPEYDDAQRFPDGGNHQPGHFVSVLSVAARFGEEQARLAIAYAGDYEPGEEADLRLSLVAIPLGAGLRDGGVAPAEVAQRARELCRGT